jgi:selenium metabolism protein YedF
MKYIQGENNMPVRVDARGQACPMPVVMAKKAIVDNDYIIVTVDNPTAMENVRRLGAKLGCSIQIDNTSDNCFDIHLTRSKDIDIDASQKDDVISCGIQKTPLVAVISSETMGSGDDALGKTLMKAFIHTLLQSDELPEKILFYNSGVKLAANDSDVLDDLKTISDAGTELLLCGTCVNFFEISESIGVGKLTNMFEIVSIMSSSSRIVKP